MKITGLVCIAIFVLPSAAFAGAFDGTWKFDPNSLRAAKKPQEFNLTGKSYTCLSCIPPTPLTADGTDQKVEGSTFDTVAVTVVGPNELRVVRKLRGKTMTDATLTIASDGNTMAASLGASVSAVSCVSAERRFGIHESWQLIAGFPPVFLT